MRILKKSVFLTSGQKLGIMGLMTIENKNNNIFGNLKIYSGKLDGDYVLGLKLADIVLKQNVSLGTGSYSFILPSNTDMSSTVSCVLVKSENGSLSPLLWGSEKTSEYKGKILSSLKESMTKLSLKTDKKPKTFSNDELMEDLLNEKLRSEFQFEKDAQPTAPESNPIHNDNKDTTPYRTTPNNQPDASTAPNQQRNMTPNPNNENLRDYEDGDFDKDSTRLWENTNSPVNRDQDNTQRSTTNNDKFMNSAEPLRDDEIFGGNRDFMVSDRENFDGTNNANRDDGASDSSNGSNAYGRYTNKNSSFGTDNSFNDPDDIDLIDRLVDRVFGKIDNTNGEQGSNTSNRLRRVDESIDTACIDNCDDTAYSPVLNRKNKTVDALSSVMVDSSETQDIAVASASATLFEATDEQIQKSIDDSVFSAPAGKHKFYDMIADQLKELFDRFPKEENLCKLIDNSNWVKIDGDTVNKHYVVGIIMQDFDIKYICYGVPGEYLTEPPQELLGYSQWLPTDTKNPYTNGYWVMYQDADTGENIYIN